AISLPKGGGAIRGTGEKFAANPTTGAGAMSVPIATSPGRSGFGPQLSLSYDSATGNSPFGFGWSLSLPSISRKTEKGLPIDAEGAEWDFSLLSNGDVLVRFFGEKEDGDWVRDAQGNLLIPQDEIDGSLVGRSRPRLEGLFARLERWTRKSDGDIHWR